MIFCELTGPLWPNMLELFDFIGITNSPYSKNAALKIHMLDVLSYFCHRHWSWQSQILNRVLMSNLPMIKVPRGTFSFMGKIWLTVSDAVNFRFKHCGRAPRGVRGIKRSNITCQNRFWQFEALIFSQNWKNAKNTKNDQKTSVFDNTLEVYSVSVES